MEKSNTWFYQIFSKCFSVKLIIHTFCYICRLNIEMNKKIRRLLHKISCIEIIKDPLKQKYCSNFCSVFLGVVGCMEEVLRASQ